MKKETTNRQPHFIIINEELKAIVQGIFSSRESAEEYINKKGLGLTTWKIEERK